MRPTQRPSVGILSADSYLASAGQMAGRARGRITRGLKELVSAGIGDGSSGDEPSPDLVGPESAYPPGSRLLRPHANMQLHVTAAHLLLQPRSAPDGHPDGAWLAVDRAHGTLGLLDAASAREHVSAAAAAGRESYSSHRAFGVVGVLKLLAGPYLIVITHAQLIGRLLGCAVLQLRGVELIPFTNAEDGGLTAEQQRSERQFASELQAWLQSGAFFFSYCLDLTRTLQHASLQPWVAPKSRRPAEGVPHPAPRPMWRRADPRFFFNLEVARELTDANLHAWALPLVQGYVQIDLVHGAELRERAATAASGGGAAAPPPPPAEGGGGADGGGAEAESISLLQLVLISRRSRLRAGQRFHTRGADARGSVGNQVETECAIVAVRAGGAPADADEGAPPSVRVAIRSYVQLRGSIPLLWQQPTSLFGRNGAPPRVHMSALESLPALSLHLRELVRVYGRVVLVNLASQAGREGALTAAYRTFVHMAGVGGVRYVGFDMHARCKGAQLQPLLELAAELDEELLAIGGLAVDATVSARSAAACNVGASSPLETARLVQTQAGVVRTNCIDCLDRTNVAQSLLARLHLERALLELGVLRAGQQLGACALLDGAFKECWANNGDALAIQYTGTGALRSDVTRSGRRTVGGLLTDGTSSVLRYYVNHFRDGAKQDVVDLFTAELQLDVVAHSLHTHAPFAELGVGARRQENLSEGSAARDADPSAPTDAAAAASASAPTSPAAGRAAAREAGGAGGLGGARARAEAGGGGGVAPPAAPAAGLADASARTAVFGIQLVGRSGGEVREAYIKLDQPRAALTYWTRDGLKRRVSVRALLAAERSPVDRRRIRLKFSPAAAAVSFLDVQCPSAAVRELFAALLHTLQASAAELPPGAPDGADGAHAGAAPPPAPRSPPRAAPPGAAPPSPGAAHAALAASSRAAADSACASHAVLCASIDLDVVSEAARGAARGGAADGADAEPGGGEAAASERCSAAIARLLALVRAETSVVVVCALRCPVAEEEWGRLLLRAFAPTHVLFATTAVRGLRLSGLVRADLAPRVHSIETAAYAARAGAAGARSRGRRRLGLPRGAGAHTQPRGGAACVALQCGLTSLCFVGVDLPASGARAAGEPGAGAGSDASESDASGSGRDGGRRGTGGGGGAAAAGGAADALASELSAVLDGDSLSVGLEHTPWHTQFQHSVLLGQPCPLLRDMPGGVPCGFVPLAPAPPPASVLPPAAEAAPAAHAEGAAHVFAVHSAPAVCGDVRSVGVAEHAREDRADGPHDAPMGAGAAPRAGVGGSTAEPAAAAQPASTRWDASSAVECRALSVLLRAPPARFTPAHPRPLLIDLQQLRWTPARQEGAARNRNIVVRVAAPFMDADTELSAQLSDWHGVALEGAPSLAAVDAALGAAHPGSPFMQPARAATLTVGPIAVHAWALELQQLSVIVAEDDPVRGLINLGSCMLPLSAPSPSSAAAASPASPVLRPMDSDDGAWRAASDGRFRARVVRTGRPNGLLWGRLCVRWLPEIDLQHVIGPLEDSPLTAQDVANAASKVARPVLGAAAEVAEAGGHALGGVMRALARRISVGTPARGRDHPGPACDTDAAEAAEPEVQTLPPRRRTIT